MARLPLSHLAFLGLALSLTPVFAQLKPSESRGRAPAGQPVQEQEPPEEDETSKPKEYTFNPLQAQKELRVGGFYFKKGSYKAAVRRFREATNWDPTSAEAFLRLGQAEEKLKNDKAAHEAYSKYLELAPDAKDAAQIRKKLESQASTASAK